MESAHCGTGGAGMLRAMTFIDGTWLWMNTQSVDPRVVDGSYRIDFGKLRDELRLSLEAQLAGLRVDMARMAFFGSFPSNVDSRDQAGADLRRDSMLLLRTVHHYEVELYPTNYDGQRLSPADRVGTSFHAHEKCVDVALASSALFLASVPNAYDVAIFVIGDRDFKPAIQAIRTLGKRVMIATIASSCASEYLDPRDPERLRDFDVVQLGDMPDRIRLSTHAVSAPAEAHNAAHASATTITKSVSGRVKFVIPDKNYGFATDGGGEDWFFHRNSLAAGLQLEQVTGKSVVGRVVRVGQPGTAGLLEDVKLDDSGS